MFAFIEIFEERLRGEDGVAGRWWEHHCTQQRHRRCKHSSTFNQSIESVYKIYRFMMLKNLQFSDLVFITFWPKILVPLFGN